jgi:hypothetical protein
MENNYTRYFEELKKTDPTSPFYTEIRKMELRIYALEESKHNSEHVTNLIKQSKTKLKELKRQQKLRETSDNFEDLKKQKEIQDTYDADIKVNLKRSPESIRRRKEKLLQELDEFQLKPKEDFISRFFKKFR